MDDLYYRSMSPQISHKFQDLFQCIHRQMVGHPHHQLYQHHLHPEELPPPPTSLPSYTPLSVQSLNNWKLHRQYEIHLLVLESLLERQCGRWVGAAVAHPGDIDTGGRHIGEHSTMWILLMSTLNLNTSLIPQLCLPCSRMPVYLSRFRLYTHQGVSLITQLCVHLPGVILFFPRCDYSCLGCHSNSTGFSTLNEDFPGVSPLILVVSFSPQVCLHSLWMSP